MAEKRIINLAEILANCKRMMKMYGFKKLNTVRPGTAGVLINLDNLQAHIYRNGLLNGVTSGHAVPKCISRELLEAEVNLLAEEFQMTLRKRFEQIELMSDEDRARREAYAKRWYDWRQPVEEAVIQLHEDGMRLAPYKKA
jgi:hypothetical protein